MQPYSRSATYFIGRIYQKRFYTSHPTFEPLRILFCGSDEFSTASLGALCKEHKRDKSLIESIDVVCRPAKPVGRGLKDTREGKILHARFSESVLKITVPISLVAKELALSLHKIDTFTKWKVSLSWSICKHQFEIRPATNTQWLANKLDRCCLIWSFDTSANPQRGQIWRAQRPSFHVTRVRKTITHSLLLTSVLMHLASMARLHYIILFYLDAKDLELLYRHYTPSILIGVPSSPRRPTLDSSMGVGQCQNY